MYVRKQFLKQIIGLKVCARFLFHIIFVAYIIAYFSVSNTVILLPHASVLLPHLRAPVRIHSTCPSAMRSPRARPLDRGFGEGHFQSDRN